MEECATHTEKQAHSEVLFPACSLQEPYIALIDMGKIIRHNPFKWSDYVQKASFVTTMLLIPSVLMTPMTQPTPLKMPTSTGYKAHVPIST